MILGAQKAMYNKAGLGYRPMQKEVKFMSLVSMNVTSKTKVTKIWVPKSFVVNIVGPNIWVLKYLIFYI